MMYFMGIDPGQSGGIAVIDEAGQPWAVKMPETERDVWTVFMEWSTRSIAALIERVSSMPKQGVSSTFKFGQNYGFLRACLIAAEIPFEEITPAQWQMKLRCRTKGNKNITKQRAQQWFPQLQIPHSTADALLLAELCRRIHKGEILR